MKINGKTLEQYSEEFRKKHGKKKNLEKYNPDKSYRDYRVKESKHYLAPIEPATFEEVLALVIRGHKLLQDIGR